MLVAPPAVGLWVLRDPLDDAALGRVSVRLADAREGDLTARSSGALEAEKADDEDASIDDPAPWLPACLAVLALAASVGDWWVTRPV
ncbi:MAG: hypothetical protein AAF907_06975 [Planctomycetota bacterium]